MESGDVPRSASLASCKLAMPFRHTACLACHILRLGVRFTSPTSMQAVYTCGVHR